MISSNMELHALSTGRKPRVVTAMTMLKQYLFRSVARPFVSYLTLTHTSRYQGHVGAALVLGGVDATGPHLFTIHPHGSTDKLPYVTMGSGSLAAMAVFEARWKPNMAVCHPTFNLFQLTPLKEKRRPRDRQRRHIGWYFQ